MIYSNKGKDRVLRIAAMICLVGLWQCPAFCALSKVQLKATYKEFLNGPTSILLTRPERQAFLHLATDDQRDTFIERFWELRNPAPGLASNHFKEEFYRRLAYADSFYARDSGSKGWRTDRGRTYILFGKPQTSMSYLGNQELYPTELWFYSNPGIAELPPFFYVLFFEGDGVSGYRFYHPYTDGPDKLLRSGGQSKQQAYRYLHDISPELANSTLSFIPGEPIDTDTFNGSMASMEILNAIEGFNEMPSYRSLIAARSQRLERVTSKVEYKLAQTDLTTFVATENGDPWIHWRAGVSDPEQPAWTGGKASFHVTSRLYSSGRLVFEQSDDPHLEVPPASAEQFRKRPIAYEDMIPVEAGHYQLAVSLTNRQTGHTYDASKEVNVAAPEVEQTGLGDPLIISKYVQAVRRQPFQFAGVKFYPSEGNYTMSSKGLSILYQIQLPAERPNELVAHYVVGQVASSMKKTWDEKLDLKKADFSGALLIAKTLPIPELAPGQYRLALRIEDPVTKKVAAAAIPFTVASEPQAYQPIVIARAQVDTPQAKAETEYQRALCLLAQDRPTKAIQALRTSWELSRNTTVKELLDHLSAGISMHSNDSRESRSEVKKKK